MSVSVRKLVSETAARLAPTSSTPRLDAELLLGHVLGWSRATLFAERNHQLTPEQQASFAALVERRANLEPIAYLVGSQGFYGLEFVVDRRVLIPRPETELLVELALKTQNSKLKTQNSKLTIADIGTGSGAIAVALATHLREAHVFAIDLDQGALAVAAHNVARHGLAERITLLQGDLLAPLPAPVDLLVSNPPYTILAEVDRGVHRHEPHLALDGGGPQGLAVYERLIAAAPRYLRPGGTLLLEIGAWQSAAIERLLAAHLPTATVQVHRDLAGHTRVAVANLPPEAPTRLRQ